MRMFPSARRRASGRRLARCMRLHRRSSAAVDGPAASLRPFASADNADRHGDVGATTHLGRNGQSAPAQSGAVLPHINTAAASSAGFIALRDLDDDGTAGGVLLTTFSMATRPGRMLDRQRTGPDRCPSVRSAVPWRRLVTPGRTAHRHRSTADPTQRAADMPDVLSQCLAHQEVRHRTEGAGQDA